VLALFKKDGTLHERLFILRSNNKFPYGEAYIRVELLNKSGKIEYNYNIYSYIEKGAHPDDWAVIDLTQSKE
jgi:hypothetical protein